MLEGRLGAGKDDRLFSPSDERRKPSHKVVRERRGAEFFEETIMADGVEGLGDVYRHPDGPLGRLLLVETVSRASVFASYGALALPVQYNSGL